MKRVFLGWRGPLHPAKLTRSRGPRRPAPLVRTGGVAALLNIAFGALALAQEAQTEFVPAESIPREELAPGPLLYGAYAFVWAVLLIYVFFLWRRIGRVERELGEVRQKLDRRP